MNNWTELKTLQDVAAAQDRGDEIQAKSSQSDWVPWNPDGWSAWWSYRSRPSTLKKIVLRRALMYSPGNGYWVQIGSNDASKYDTFVKYLPGEEEVEVIA